MDWNRSIICTRPSYLGPLPFTYDSNQTEQIKINRIGEEKIRLSDDSELTGYLIRLDAEQNLFWQNKSISGEINFDYKSVSNIFFNRLVLLKK